MSLFSLLICLAGGICPIITSSSDKKLQRVATLGPDGFTDTINYRGNPDLEEEIVRLTIGKVLTLCLKPSGVQASKKVSSPWPHAVKSLGLGSWEDYSSTTSSNPWNSFS